MRTLMKNLHKTTVLFIGATLLATGFSLSAFAQQPNTEATYDATSEAIVEEVEQENALFNSYDIEIHSNNKHPSLYSLTKYNTSDCVWETSDTSIATVSQTGVVTAQGLGTATITATKRNSLTGNTDTTKYTITVKKATTTLSDSSKTLTIDYDVRNPSFQLEIEDSYYPITRTTWYSSNTDVATVSSSGVVTAVSEGSAMIYADTNDGRVSCSVTVDSDIGKVRFRSGEYSASTSTVVTEQDMLGNLKPGDTVPLNSYIVKDDRVQIAGWSSSNPAVAEVTESGYVTAKADGEAIITVTSTEGKSAQCRLIVGEAAIQEYQDELEAEQLKSAVTLVAFAAVIILILAVSSATSA